MRAPRNAKCLQFFFSFRCLFVDKSKVVTDRWSNVCHGLFGDSPCWDSRRDKNKSFGMLEIRRRIMEGIQTVSEGGQKKCKVPWSFSIRQKEFRIKKSEVGHETVNKGFTFSNGTDFRQVWPDRQWPRTSAKTDEMEENPKASRWRHVEGEAGEVQVNLSCLTVFWPAGKLPNKGTKLFCWQGDMRKKERPSDGTRKWKKRKSMVARGLEIFSNVENVFDNTAV